MGGSRSRGGRQVLEKWEKKKTKKKNRYRNKDLSMKPEMIQLYRMLMVKDH